MINAGASYGAAKQIGSMYPGPAILLLGAAIQAIGEGNYPNEELENHIILAKSKLESTELGNDEDIKAVLSAAKERAGFEKVSKLMRTEFRKGLQSGGYSKEWIDSIVPKIVNITHAVRHRGVIDKLYSHIIEPNTTCIVRGPSGCQVGCGIHQEYELYKSEEEISDARRPPIVQDSSEGISDLFAEIGHITYEGGLIMITSDFQDLRPYAQKSCANRILSCIDEIKKK